MPLDCTKPSSLTRPVFQHPAKAGPHCLRHTFATWYLRAGGGVRQLQDILGHTKIETTMIYVQLAGRDVQADHSRYSPARTMGWLNG